jgi:hypothetical protein
VSGVPGEVLNEFAKQHYQKSTSARAWSTWVDIEEAGALAQLHGAAPHRHRLSHGFDA